jgi:hypothetical protein
MAGGRPPSFIGSRARTAKRSTNVVKVEAGPETTEAEVTCRACGAPLPGREGTADIGVEISDVATPIPLTGQKRDGHWMDTAQVLKR